VAGSWNAQGSQAGQAEGGHGSQAGGDASRRNQDGQTLTKKDGQTGPARTRVIARTCVMALDLGWSLNPRTSLGAELKVAAWMSLTFD
jgi:hypothetical protein